MCTIHKPRDSGLGLGCSTDEGQTLSTAGLMQSASSTSAPDTPNKTVSSGKAGEGCSTALVKAAVAEAGLESRYERELTRLAAELFIGREHS